MTRRCISLAEISSTSARIASIGASERPTSFHVVSPTRPSSSGRPTRSSPPTTRVVSPTGSSVRAVTTVRCPFAVVAPFVTARNRSLSRPNRITVECPGRRWPMTSFPSSSGVAATSVARSSSTWIWKSSSTPVTSRSGDVPDFNADNTSSARRSVASRTSSVSVLRSTARTPTEPATSAIPTITTAAAVARKRTVPVPARSRAHREGPASATVGRQPVPRPAERLDRSCDRRAGRACCAGAARTPRRCSGRPRSRSPRRDRGSRVSTRRLPCRRSRNSSSAQLPCGELDLRLPAPTRASSRIQPQVAGDENRRSFATAPPEQRPQPRHQHRVRERLLRKSSAPVSSASTSSHSPSLAVSMRIGVQLRSARRIAQIR